MTNVNLALTRWYLFQFRLKKYDQSIFIFGSSQRESDNANLTSYFKQLNANTNITNLYSRL